MNDIKYWKSKKWRRLKKKVAKKLNGRKCVICGTDKQVCLHHLTYRNYGHEHADDCILLCLQHHEELHNYCKENKKTIEYGGAEWLGNIGYKLSLNFYQYLKDKKSKKKNVKTIKQIIKKKIEVKKRYEKRVAINQAKEKESNLKRMIAKGLKNEMGEWID